jgi:hypothetical protein
MVIITQCKLTTIIKLCYILTTIASVGFVHLPQQPVIYKYIYEA